MTFLTFGTALATNDLLMLQRGDFIISYRWICDYCGSEWLEHHQRCPSCGAPKTPRHSSLTYQ